jgi:hypothetical protein
VTKRCHDNSRGTNFNEINIVKLFADRMKMKRKLKAVQIQEIKESVSVSGGG